MRKPRSDASPFDRYREDLDQWLLVENLSYDEVLKRLKAIWKEVDRMPSRTSLQRWADRRRQEKVLDRIQASAQSANAVRSALAENPSDCFGALLGMIGQAAFEIRMQSGDAVDINVLKDLAQLAGVGLKARHDEAVLKLREQELGLKERRIVLLEKQAADATDVIKDGELTDEQKMARFREIFGIKV